MLRVIDQIVNPGQALLPEAKGWGQLWLSRVDNLICQPQHRAWLFLLHQKSIVHSPCLCLYFRSICKMQRIEHELVHGFSNNYLPCKQVTTFSLLLTTCSKIQIKFNQNYRTELWNFIRIIMDGICSQLVLTIERLEGNPHLSPVVIGSGRLIKLFPAKLYCDIQKKFTWGVIIVNITNLNSQDKKCFQLAFSNGNYYIDHLGSLPWVAQNSEQLWEMQWRRNHSGWCGHGQPKMSLIPFK